VLSGDFVATLPDHLIAPSIVSGALRKLPIEGGTVERKAGLIQRAGVQARPAVQQFLQQVRLACAAVSRE
jgi:DNA-binding transcriptional LysR family regulator